MEETNDSIIKKAQTAITKPKDSIVNVIDANGNGEIDIEDFIIIGLKTPVYIQIILIYSYWLRSSC